MPLYECSSRYKPDPDRRDRNGHDKRHKRLHSPRPHRISSSVHKVQSSRLSPSRLPPASESTDGPLLKRIKIEKPDEPEKQITLEPDLLTNGKEKRKKAKKSSDPRSVKNIPPVLLAIDDKSMPLLKMIKKSYERQLKGVAELKHDVKEKATAMETYLKDDYRKVLDEIETQQIAASMQRNAIKRRKKMKMLKLKAARHQKQRMKRKLKRQEIHKIRNTIGESPF